jgi:hypothetical protein
MRSLKQVSLVGETQDPEVTIAINTYVWAGSQANLKLILER